MESWRELLNNENQIEQGSTQTIEKQSEEEQGDIVEIKMEELEQSH